jgi:hypothetical protein
MEKEHHFANSVKFPVRHAPVVKVEGEKAMS